jgi:hypothetical protein
MLDAAKVAPIQAAIKKAGIDGWLLYDFRGMNPIAGGSSSCPGSYRAAIVFSSLPAARRSR